MMRASLQPQTCSNSGKTSPQSQATTTPMCLLLPSSRTTTTKILSMRINRKSIRCSWDSTKKSEKSSCCKIESRNSEIVRKVHMFVCINISSYKVVFISTFLRTLHRTKPVYSLAKWQNKIHKHPVSIWMSWVYASSQLQRQTSNESTTSWRNQRRLQTETQWYWVQV